jgi:hypothetical protein
MSLTSTAPSVTGATGATGVAGASRPGPAAPRRVRHQARDVVLLMAFSAVTSTALAAGLLALTHLSRAAGR